MDDLGSSCKKLNGQSKAPSICDLLHFTVKQMCTIIRASDEHQNISDITN